MKNDLSCVSMLIFQNLDCRSDGLGYSLTRWANTHVMGPHAKLMSSCWPRQQFKGYASLSLDHHQHPPLLCWKFLCSLPVWEENRESVLRTLDSGNGPFRSTPLPPLFLAIPSQNLRENRSEINPCSKFRKGVGFGALNVVVGQVRMPRWPLWTEPLQTDHAFPTGLARDLQIQNEPLKRSLWHLCLSEMARQQ